MIILIFNAILYLISACISLKKYKYTLYTFLWIYFSIYSFLGIIVLYIGVYEEQVNIYNKQISLIPYIINYICTLILISPLKQIDSKHTILSTSIQLKKLKPFINILFLIIIIYMMERFYELVQMSNLSLVERYAMIAGEGEDVLPSNSPLIIVRKITGLIYFSSFPIIISYFINLLIIKKIRFKQCLLYICICISPYLIMCISSGGRSELYLVTLRIFFFILFFYSFFNKKIQRKIISGFIGILCILAIVVISISISRFENTSGVWESIIRYLGETYPNMGYVYWDNVKNHSMGQDSYPFIYELLSGKKPVNPPTGFFEKYAFWEEYTGVPVLYFKPLFCNYYIKYGTFIAIILIILIALIMRKYISRHTHIYLYNVPILYFYSISCCHSIIGDPFNTKNLQILLATIILCSIVKLLQKKKIVIKGMK
jgi:oligosaccharide repeat unit polymerase